MAIVSVMFSKLVMFPLSASNEDDVVTCETVSGKRKLSGEMERRPLKVRVRELEERKSDSAETI